MLHADDELVAHEHGHGVAQPLGDDGEVAVHRELQVPRRLAKFLLLGAPKDVLVH